MGETFGLGLGAGHDGTPVVASDDEMPDHTLRRIQAIELNCHCCEKERQIDVINEGGK